MSSETLCKLIKNIHDMIELDEKKKVLYFQLIEALTVKTYKDENPDKVHVYLVSYYGLSATSEKDRDGNAKFERDKYRTYEALDKENPKMQKLLRLSERMFGSMDKDYKDISVKHYDLTKFESGKTVAKLISN